MGSGLIPACRTAGTFVAAAALVAAAVASPALARGHRAPHKAEVHHAQARKPEPPRIVTLRVDSGAPEGHPLSAKGWPAFKAVAERASGDTLKLQLFTAGGVTGAERVLAAVSGGDVDITYLEPARRPNRFPTMAFLAELSMVGPDPLAAAAAVSDYVLLHCRPCETAFRDQNIVFLGTYATPPYLLFAARMPSGDPPLAGFRVWSPGGAWDRWTRSLGGEPMGGSGSVAKALAAGRIDAVVETPLALRDPVLRKAARQVLRLPLGSQVGSSPFTVNRETWRKLSTRQRRALLSAAAAGIAATSNAYLDAAERALPAAAATPKPPEALAAATGRFAEGDLDRLAATADERLGLSDGPAVLAALKELYAKHAALLAKTARREDQIAAELRREIFDRVDADHFAMTPRPEESEGTN